MTTSQLHLERKSDAVMVAASRPGFYLCFCLFNPLGGFLFAFMVGPVHFVDALLFWPRRRKFLEQLISSLHVVRSHRRPDGSFTLRLGYRRNEVLRVAIDEEVVSEEIRDALVKSESDQANSLFRCIAMGREHENPSFTPSGRYYYSGGSFRGQPLGSLLQSRDVGDVVGTLVFLSVWTLATSFILTLLFKPEPGTITVKTVKDCAITVFRLFLAAVPIAACIHRQWWATNQRLYIRRRRVFSGSLSDYNLEAAEDGAANLDGLKMNKTAAEKDDDATEMLSISKDHLETKENSKEPLYSDAKANLGDSLDIGAEKAPTQDAPVGLQPARDDDVNLPKVEAGIPAAIPLTLMEREIVHSDASISAELNRFKSLLEDSGSSGHLV